MKLMHDQVAFLEIFSIFKSVYFSVFITVAQNCQKLYQIVKDERFPDWSGIPDLLRRAMYYPDFGIWKIFEKI